MNTNFPRMTKYGGLNRRAKLLFSSNPVIIGIYALPLMAMAFLLTGCGRSSGPVCYEVSGVVTYNGQPVPTGYILFAPDKTKGNDGPGVNAEIRDGKYRTPAGQGVIGGPHTATINSYDGRQFQAGPVANPMGKPLSAPIQIALDLPKQASTHDFVLPVTVKNVK